jgi:hypothetical protein
MCLPRILALPLLTAQLFALAANLHAQTAPAAALLDSTSAAPAATLKICLRLADESPFLGPATVRVTPEEGNELLGMPADAPGEFLFSGVTSGKYIAVVGAPGYTILTLNFKIDQGPRQKSLFIPMKPKLASSPDTSVISVTPQPHPLPHPLNDVGDVGPAPASPLPTAPADPPASSGESSAVSGANALLPSSPPPASNGRNFWEPNELEASVPPIDPAVSCPAEAVLRGVGQRMAEFVQTLERFTATEKLEHFSIDRNGARKSPETRSFAYVVSVSRNSVGTFLLDEYRNGKEDAEEFPAHTASRGSPAMALLFHPALASDFDFRCEGLGQWAGRPAWQVHFAQRPDRPIRIRSYSVAGRSAGLPIQGRVWIDPGNYQVIHLESELMKPIPEVALTHEHFTIDYQPVQFRSTGQQLWLPQTAELYVERKGKRFYRRHVFSDFMLFNVDASQNIQIPHESFSFTNLSDRSISGQLTVERREPGTGDPVMLWFAVPAHQRIFKLVGPGKDIDLPLSAVGDATFIHEGDPGAIKVDTHLSSGGSLDVLSNTKPASPEQSSHASGPPAAQP